MKKLKDYIKDIDKKFKISRGLNEEIIEDVKEALTDCSNEGLISKTSCKMYMLSLDMDVGYTEDEIINNAKQCLDVMRVL